MSGAANRRRGADAERKVCAWLREHGYPDARRYLAGDGKQPGDVDAIPGVVIEVKDRKSSSWPSWMAQALTEAGPDRQAVVVRRTRGNPDVGTWEARWSVRLLDSDCNWTGDYIWDKGTFAEWLELEQLLGWLGS